VGKRSGGDHPGPGREENGPPCEHAGDDRHGPEQPPWVRPSSSGNAGSWAAANDSDFARTHPTLHSFLTLTGYGGAARQSGTVGISAEDGVFKAALNDRDGGFFAFVSSKSLAGLWDKLEAGLKGGGLDWRASKYRKK